ncbi:DUF5363 domain-containing protein [Mergibacter septicus]|uniref:DUF5363 domain-containing protein n=1 Tax=Mergibacter septicus TaxID=221402 RepID=UPI0021C2F6AC|nr:DUF5363 domain-containing protein [Mergibacter septicus]UTU47516.1 DUF5363 domain-containing protein [Mergibacter septicus]WMR95304.1 DUF5363 domain-containing protein [Mergibacter septicus]
MAKVENKTTSKLGFFKRALAKYDQFCKELGIDKGACRSCVPIYKEDPELTEKDKSQK